MKAHIESIHESVHLVYPKKQEFAWSNPIWFFEMWYECIKKFEKEGRTGSIPEN